MHMSQVKPLILERLKNQGCTPVTNKVAGYAWQNTSESQRKPYQDLAEAARVGGSVVKECSWQKVDQRH